jgi:hypothetical protein
MARTEFCDFDHQTASKMKSSSKFIGHKDRKRRLENVSIGSMDENRFYANLLWGSERFRNAGRATRV